MPGTASAGDRPGARLWITMLAFGFASGLPLFLTNFTLQQWLSERHASLRTIGAVAWVGLPYLLKFVWAPVFDRVRLPLLGRLGRRRSWLATVQVLLALALLWLGSQDPPHRLAAIALAAGLVAFASASQDVVIDAWRIESFPAARQGEALALYVWGYRIAILVSQSGAIFLAGRVGWHGAYAVMAALALAGLLTTLVAPEPDVGRQAEADAATGPSGAGALAPLLELLRRPGVVPVLLFVFLFQLGTAFADTMAAPFYRALGFDRAAIVLSSSVPMIAGGVVGAGLGGLLVARVGALRATLLGGLVQMASMLLYVVLAHSGADRAVLVAKVTLEALAEGMASAAFLSYLSGLCAAAYTATQYALLSGLAALAWRTLAGTSGMIAGAVGWQAYFVLTSLACVPALLLLAVIGRRTQVVTPAAT